MEVRNDGVSDERLPADMAFNDLSAGRLMGGPRRDHLDLCPNRQPFCWLLAPLVGLTFLRKRSRVWRAEPKTPLTRLNSHF